MHIMYHMHNGNCKMFLSMYISSHRRIFFKHTPPTQRNIRSSVLVPVAGSVHRGTLNLNSCHIRCLHQINIHMIHGELRLDIATIPRQVPCHHAILIKSAIQKIASPISSSTSQGSLSCSGGTEIARSSIHGIHAADTRRISESS